MKQNNIYFIILLIVSIHCVSCENLLEPENENFTTFEQVYKDPEYAEGLLMTVYSKLPTNSLKYTEVATDDAVSNNTSNGFLKMATGQWSALYNPVSEWNNSNSAIFYINQFIPIIDTVGWKWSNEEINGMFKKRLKGEAYALKALFEYHLLVTIGGIGKDNQLLGIPIYNEFMKFDADFNVPRASFAESVKQIYADLDKASEYLTMDDYYNISSASQLPPGYERVNTDNYNTVFGDFAKQRISGRIVKGIKARVALLEASPAFSNGDIALWEKAADYAAVLIDKNNGIEGLDPDGHRFFEGAMIEAIISTKKEQEEIIWRKAIGATSYREAANYPPSLYGRGEVNPSQNLVDAFPCINGYPISDPRSGYNPEEPYANRDPRLALYIVYDGSKLKGNVIHTGVGGKVDAKDSIATSTRTGYYLRKMLREDVNLDPVSPAAKNHYDTHMRYTELYLSYAEAANEAWGPDGTGNHSYSARDVIRAIRKRAGISQPDLYVNSISTKEEMRKLIRNERRIELCFEGFRFWDLRRWKEDLTPTVKGVNIHGRTFDIVDVEERKYDNSYMHYAPLPEGEVLKFNALVQNKGW